MGPKLVGDRPKHRVRFGEFELDWGSGELTRRGRKVSIQHQPLRLLFVLVTQAGEVVTRDQIRRALWPDDSFGEFDAGVGNAIRKIRLALGDSADNPRFVQTIPREGFRFIAPVHYVVPRAEGQVEPEEPRPAPVIVSSSPPVEAPSPPEVPAQLPARPVGWRLAIAAAVLLLAAVLERGLVMRNSAPQTVETIATQTRPFTAFAGREERPAFSPDGNTIAFDWGGSADGRLHIWVQAVTAAAPSRITQGDAPEYSPAWSPDGTQIAFIRHLPDDRAAIYSVTVLGSGERKWGEFSRLNLGLPKLSWSADGKWFAVPERLGTDVPSYILLISAENGARRALTAPSAGWLGDAEPAISPDGRLVAFRRTRTTGVEDLYTVAVEGGEPRRLTFDNAGLSALTWTPDSRSIVFSSKRAGATRGLWRIGVNGGAPVRLTPSVVDASQPAVSSKGGRLAYVSTVFDVNIWELQGTGKSAVQRPLIDSNVLDSGAQFSPDGRRIAFRSTRSGSDEVWIVNADGSAPRQVTTFGRSLTGSPRWSPDGQSLLFESRVSGNGDIYLVSSEGGKPTRLTQESSNEILPSWSHDGKNFYFASDRTGSWQIWRQGVAGGPAEQITRNGGFAGFESRDGQWLYYSKEGKTDGVWRVPTGAPGAAETLVLDAVAADMWGNWAAVANGIYYVDHPKPPVRSTIRFFEFSTRATRVLAELSNIPAVADSGLAVSPDESRILYSQVDRYGSDIFLVSGFK